MKPTPAQRWTRFQSLYREFPECDLAVDLSRLDFDDDFLRRMAKPMTEALESMRLLEAGHEANPDEHRKVGHYWLRQPSLAPTPELRAAISETLDDLKKFAASVHAGDIRGKDGPFEHVLVIGIGGSALGPQFVARALGHPLTDKLRIHFFDNTDPDGMDRTLAPLLPQLGRALVVVISKSGTTPETRNGLLEAAEAFRRAGVPFAPQAVAITQFDPQKSELYGRALEEQWRAAFPMWDWVGGRTSETSVVGLLPAALQGFDVDDFLAGARDCDALTRSPEPIHNPAALLALGWYHAGNGRGDRDMVILPYKDRLELFSRYLQQLIMESLGKELDLSGCIVHQGIAVYGNKGSTDQHAYVQQLRDGLHNFFVVFIQVLRGRVGESIQVGPEVTSADYLNGLLLGTRAALHEKGRESITLTIPEVTPRTVGMLIALFERAVGLYAFLVRINAYHQPGVEAGKTAAASVLDLQGSILRALRAEAGRPFTAGQLSVATGHDDPETIFKVCQHLAANSSGVIRSGTGCDATFNV